MKKLGTLLLLLSVGMFSFGCARDEGAPAGNGNGAVEPAPADGSGENGNGLHDTAPAEEPAPADDTE